MLPTRRRRSSRGDADRAYEALTRLYSRVGLWAKVVESLQQPGRPDRRQGQGRATCGCEVATVYEKELALADRAVEAYEAMLAEIPDDAEALAALDRLHEAHGRFEDLQEILRRRAALANGRRAARDRPPAREDPARNASTTPRRPPRRLRELGPKPSPTTR